MVWSSWPDSKPVQTSHPCWVTQLLLRRAGGPQLLLRGKSAADSALAWKCAPPSFLLLPSFSGLRLESGEVETSETLLHDCIQDLTEWVYW